MLRFQKLTLDDIPVLEPFFRLSKTRACDNTIGGSFMWRDFFRAEYAVYNGSMICKVLYLNGRTAFSMPLGGDVPAALAAIRGWCLANELPMTLCTVTAEDVALVKSLFTAAESPEPDWSDYLYEAEALASMTGHKYNGQRNHMNRFRREYPDYRFAALDAGTLPAVREFFAAYSAGVQKDSAIFAEEERKVFEVLDNFELYRQTGLVLLVGGAVAAFAAGEIVGDTLFVHIEKADTSFAGAYQMIVSEFARQSLEKGIEFVNREEDVGDPGLRTSKLSYHPCALIEKYTVVVAAD